MRSIFSSVIVFTAVAAIGATVQADHIRDLQAAAVQQKQAEFGHWGWDPDNYMHWGSHSNRLIPVYTFGTAGGPKGVNLDDYTGPNSFYRDADRVRGLYGYVPEQTVNPNANYLDQTNIFDLQQAALKAGKKQIILVVFDGMDWQTTWAAAVSRSSELLYRSGRGTGLHLQDYDAAGTTQFGYMVTSPYAASAKFNVDTQQVDEVKLTTRGGYASRVAGTTPWETSQELKYLVGQSDVPELKQAYTDSSSSATSMTAGIKTYNKAVNIDPQGRRAETIAHLAQKKGYQIGVVTSVPISHATPASAYAHNVSRNDYQDLTRDLLGLPSVSHPDKPLAGVDVLIGAGFGANRTKDNGQGENFVPGNAYLAESDRLACDVRNGGKYIVSIRESGVDGAEQLKLKAQEAAETGKRLFGFYGVSSGHLPFQTADGKYDPVQGRRKSAESYSEEDLRENPTLAEMTSSALTVLQQRQKPFWLMVEAGDVDWANHDNNIDNSIGAVLSGDAAIKVVTDWVEENSSWEDTVLIVTADHGHLLVLEKPEMLCTGK